MNKISELLARQANVEVKGTVTDLGATRTFDKFGEPGRVCNATIQDDSGSMTLTLWNEQVDDVQVGDIVHVTSGYVSEWQGHKQLSTGKYGKMSVEKGKAGKAAAKAKSETKPEKKSAKTKKDKTPETEATEENFDTDEESEELEEEEY
jgi:replication factor A1